MGLYELAEASGLALRIDTDAVLWFDAGLEVCRGVGADPWGTLASGTALATFAPEEAASALAALQETGRPCARIGRAEAGSGVRAETGEPVRQFERDEVARVLSQPPHASVR
jgi:hydrogenase maturation factor